MQRAREPASGSRIRRVLREPLLHFFALGAVLFGLYGVLDRGSHDVPDEIVVSRDQQRNLQLQFERVWRRPATAEELRGLVDNWVKEEIFYREGVSLGLDRDDVVVRRRVGQKLAFIAESVAPPAPTEAELQAWLDAHVADYQVEPVYSLRQVYFDPGKHPGLDADIAAARRNLVAGKSDEGDATLLPARLDAASASETRRVFGDEFAKALEALPIGGWQGPVRSTFGWHLVALTERNAGRPPTLAEARANVERDLLRARLQQANDAFYDRLRGKYAVRIEGTDATPKPAG